MDESLFRWINGWSEVLSPIFLFFSEGNKWTFVRVGLAVVAIGLLAYRPTRLATIVALMAWPLANAMSDVLKFALQSPRPCVALEGVHLRVGEMTSPGMPSAHSANTAAVAASYLMLAGPRWGGTWLAVALLTGISRVYVGVHFPSQVLVGWAIGFYAGWMLVKAGQNWVRLRSAPGAKPAEAK